MTTTDATRTTRRRVLEAAAAISAEAGFDAVSVAALGTRSGVSNGSVYHHFGSKNGVLAALLHDAISEYQALQIASLDRHAADPRAGVQAAIELHLSWVERHPEQGRLLLQHRDDVFDDPDRERLSALNQAFLDRNRAWLADHARAGRLPVVEVEVAHAIVFAPCQALCRHWLLDRTATPPRTRAVALGAAAWAGLLAQGTNVPP